MTGVVGENVIRHDPTGLPVVEDRVDERARETETPLTDKFV
jgi:hypothetical protein